MILEALGLTTSGIAGAVFSELSEWRRGVQQRKHDEAKLKLAQEARLQGQVFDFLNQPDGIVTTPVFGKSFYTLVRTYCICIILCVCFPDREIWTFDPNSIPREFSIFWGFVSWDIGAKYVFRITLGGVAYGLLNLLAFQIGTVITGITPSQQAKRQ